MNSSEKLTRETLNEIFESWKKHIGCVAKLVKNLETGEEFLGNIALYHLSMCAKIMLRIVCLRFAEEYTDDDSLEELFGKTAEYLPSGILEMEADICYWHNEVQYKTENIKTNDETYDAAKTIEGYFDEYTRAYCMEMCRNIVKESKLFVEITSLSKF